MSWSGSAAGDYHTVVRQLKGIRPAGDHPTVEFGHVDAVRDAALTIIDKAPTDAAISVTIAGHTTDRETFSGSVSVQIVPSKRTV